MPAGNSVRRVLLFVMISAFILILPFTLFETIKMGRLYLFTDEFWTDLITRFQGPGRFRFILQPLMGALLGVAHGKKDGATKSLVRYSGVQFWRQLLELLSIPLMIGILADVIFQFVLFHNVHIFPALLIGPLFVTGPYIMARASTHVVMKVKTL